MVDRKDVDTALLTLSWRQRDDLVLFQRLKKWTAALLALHWRIDQSSANRRLHQLVKLGALAVRRGQPWPDGGRTPDVYYLTPLGARLVTRLQRLGGSYVEAPDVTNEVDNTHDLATLEVAVRLGVINQARAFEKWTMPSCRGGQITVIPDLRYLYEAHGQWLCFEIEQTLKAQHILRKFETYAEVSVEHLGQPRKPRLIMVYPSRESEQRLLIDHAAAAQDTQAMYYQLMPMEFYAVSLPRLRERGVTDLAGLSECLTDLLTVDVPDFD